MEIKAIMDKAYSQAVAMIKSERKMLDKVSEALLKKETLEREDFEKIVGKKEESSK